MRGAGKLPEKAKAPIRSTFESSERLVGIVNDLLNISKADLGKLEMHKDVVDLRNIVEGIVKEFKPKVEEKGLDLTFEKPDKPDKVEIDKMKIRQVVFNVIDNASKYTDEGGVEVRIEEVDSTVRVIVKDTGEGMTDDEEKKIFESFTRGEAGIDKWGQGTGLGLYLAKRYMEFHGGDIWVESEGKGKGSTFFIEFPKIKARQDVKKPERRFKEEWRLENSKGE